MKNKDLRDYVEAMNLQLPQAARSQEVVRRAVLASPRHQTLGMRVLWAFTNRRNTMFKNKKIIGAGAMALLVLSAASFGVYTYRFSPKALAEQVINQGFVAISAAPSDKITKLETVLGTSPKEALEEAKKAKDLRVITKEEFDEEVKRAGGMFGTSLSDDPNAPSFGMATVGAVDGAGYGTPPEGTVVSGGAGVMLGENGQLPNVNVEQGQVVVGSGEAGQQNGPSTTIVMNGTTPPQDGATYHVNMMGAAPQTDGVTTGTVQLPENFKPFPMETPSKYLRYTNSEGKVVVLSLNADGLPIFKSLLLKPGQMQNVQIRSAR